MGIRGLTTFINENSTRYYDKYQLKDSLVIIDGNALTNFLYDKYENNTSAFGGDYDIIANVYIDFINMLIRCNVTPVFVFDGVYEQRKIKTAKQRMSDSIIKYNEPKKTKECKTYLGKDIIFDILNDMEIPHINCDFEADSEIVILAKLLDCCVMSRDSDFYLNTIPYIPFHTISLDLESSENVITCGLYKVEKLLEDFGQLHIDYLPLIAALMGNDYIRPDTFNSLLGSKFDRVSCRLKLKIITDWLKEQNDVNSAIYNMTNNLPQRDDIIKQIQNIIQDYKTVNSKYLIYILQYKKMNEYQERLKDHLKTNEGSDLPDWLENYYRIGKVNSGFMTIKRLKKVFFKVCIEDIDKPPCYEVSIKILEKIFELIFEKNEVIQGIGRRIGYNLGKFEMKTFTHNSYVPLANLNEKSLEYRKNIILNLIGITNFDGFPKEWELFILILIYWAIDTNNCESSHLHALIINGILFNIIKKTERNKPYETFKKVADNSNLTDKSIIEQNIFNVNKDDCSKSLSIMSEYFQINRYDDKNLYNKFIHPYAQFQCCVYNFLILNSLLDFPYEQCRIQNFYKGSFLYNLIVKMENHNPEVFVSQELFNGTDSLNKVYRSIISHLDKLISNRKIEIVSGSSSGEPESKRKRFN